jgi:C_GCAxxG_C_C family probable redox protein
LSRRENMERKAKAVQHFEENYNCAQSVLAVFADDFGIDQNQAISLATGFGAGIARSCQVCGAVSGACMVIGFQFGSKPSDAATFRERKEKTYLLVSDFLEEFRKKNQSTNCRELTGYDLDDPIQHAEAKRLGIFSTRCTRFVSDAVEITEEIFNSIPPEV